MSMSEPLPETSDKPRRRYLRPPVPVHFPVEDEVGESGWHFELKTALYLTVKHVVGARGAVGSEQFVYWDPTNPKKCLAPDLMVHLGSAPRPFTTWKTWERGAPHLGLELTSPSDTPPVPYRRKLERYLQAGIAEVVWFDRQRSDAPLRLWDRVEGDLVERDLAGPDALLCDTLGLYWCVREDPVLEQTLRLARDAAGTELIPTLDEERTAAVARVAELEAELRRRG